MRLRHLLGTFLLCGTVTVGAQDEPIHGVDGYWNWTSQRMSADGIIKIDGNTGNKDKNFPPQLYLDGDYMSIKIGVGDLSKNWWRATAHFNNQGKEQAVKITKKYPVLAIKFSLPKENMLENESNASSFSAEFWWKCPYTNEYKTMTNVEGYGISGLNNQGRIDFMSVYPGIICSEDNNPMKGREKVKIAYESNYTKFKTTEDGIVYINRETTVNGTKHTSFAFMVLPDKADRCEYICIMNYGSIADAATEGKAESGLLLDRTDIESVGFNLMVFGYRTIEGCTEAPEASIKWLKTFKSYDDAMSALTEANNWGDGPKATVDVNIAAGKYATCIFPFAPDFGGADVKVYSCNAKEENGTTLKLEEVATPEANKPYILYSASGCNKNLTGYYNASGNVVNEGNLYGVLQAASKTITDSYVLQTQNGVQAFYAVSADDAITVPQYRAYLNISSDAGVNALRLVLPGDDDATAISEVAAESATVDVYSFSGVLVRKGVKASEALDGLQKGIYVVNGVKKAVK